MRPPNAEMTLRDYGRVVVRRRWVIGVAMLAAVITALAVSFLTDPIYESEAQMLVEVRESGGLFDQGDSGVNRDEVRAIQTEIQVLEGQKVRERVQQQLGSPLEPPDVTGQSVAQTDVVAVRVRSADPRTAQILADAYVEGYIDLRRDQAVERLLVASQAVQAQIDELQTQINELSQFDSARQALVIQQAAFAQSLDQLQVDASLTTGGASVVKAADLPTDPVAPQPVRSVSLAAAVGLIIGLAAAFLIDYIDDSVESTDDLRDLSALPTLATLPLRPPGGLRPLAITDPSDHAVEIYRGIRTSVQILGLDRQIRLLQVTSAVAGEGKTTTASNLAIVLAQAGQRVLLIDTDQRHPRLHDVFDLPQHPGLTDLVLGDDVDAVAHRIELDGLAVLDVVASGPLSPQPSDTLSSAAMRDVLHGLAVRYDYVILDAAPVLPVTDAVATAPAVDALLLVVSAGTSGRTVAAALTRLEQVAAPVIGLVLNKATATPLATYEYSSYLPTAGAGAAGR